MLRSSTVTFTHISLSKASCKAEPDIGQGVHSCCRETITGTVIKSITKAYFILVTSKMKEVHFFLQEAHSLVKAISILKTLYSGVAIPCDQGQRTKSDKRSEHLCLWYWGKNHSSTSGEPQLSSEGYTRTVVSWV